VQDLRDHIEKTVVGPIFESVGRNGRKDQSLPEVVLANRKNRAYGRLLDALDSRGGATIPEELRKRLESMIEAWSTQAFDDAFAPIQEFEIVCARERDLVRAEESGDPRKVLAVRETEYRRRIVERLGSIELRGLQLSHRVILDLDRVYVPLSFEEMVEPGPGLPRAPRLIDRILKESARIFLIGAPGSGKSTLVSFLASRCATGDHRRSWPRRSLPFVVTVREVKDAEISPEWLAAQSGVAVELVMAALGENRAVLLIDGLDEAPVALRGKLTAGLARFTESYPGMPVVVTSRPAGTPGEMETCLPGFRGFRVADLTKEEVGIFIDKWCLAAETSARPDSSEARQQAAAAAADLKSRIARSRPVERIAVNPLLATIVCVVHRFLGRTIPEHRVTLYQKCTDALLYEWDRARFPKNAAVGSLDANQKRALLQGVASALHEKHEAEIPESEVVRHFAARLPEMGQPQEDALRIVREIRDRSGVLVERRPGAFAFSHLTFQEYLTALDYAPRSQDLLTHAADPWWHEVIALACGITGCDTQAIIRSYLSRKTRDDVLMAAKCLETAISVPIELRKEVEQALERVLPGPNPSQLLECGMTAAPILARDLLSYSTPDKTWALLFFWRFAYEPLIPVLKRLTRVEEPSLASVGHHRITVGELAILTLYEMAKTSDLARSVVISVLSEDPQSEEFLVWLSPWSLLGDEFRPSRLGKRGSKRAKSTV